MKVRRVKGVDLSVALEGLQKNTCKVGFFETAKYEDGTPVAYVAAIHEFGVASRSIPPRPFFRPTMAEKKTNWQKIMRGGANKIAKGELTADAVYDLLGLQAAGDVRKTISKIKEPPLTLTTLLLRKRKLEGDKVTGKTVGEVKRNVDFIGPREKGDKSLDVKGVPTKPLVWDGILKGSVVHAVGPKDDTGKQST